MAAPAQCVPQRPRFQLQLPHSACADCVRTLRILTLHSLAPVWAGQVGWLDRCEWLSVPGRSWPEVCGMQQLHAGAMREFESRARRAGQGGRVCPPTFLSCTCF